LSRAALSNRAVGQWLFVLFSCTLVASAMHAADPISLRRETRQIEGWSVHISRELLTHEGKQTEQALKILQSQLNEIVRVMPKAAVAELQKVPLWFSPEYAGTPPRAEYHPGTEWLRANGRDTAMVKSIEFTNVRIFEAEQRRMPNFALHELAHAYHDLVLSDGFNNKEIKAAYDHAVASGIYKRVERKDAQGGKSQDKAYAVTNPQEYFAECSEAFFSRNDFYPYSREELQKHDPRAARLLAQLWGTK
jgi:hypothetical protein